MIKVLGAVTRRPGMTHAEYLAYIQYVHGKITTDNPLTISRYMQSHVFDGAFGSHAEATHCMPVARDSVTELCFDNAEAMIKTFSSDYVKQTVGPDAKNFSDEANSLSVMVTEVEQTVINPAQACGAKV
ncbi:MAG: EthD domain-containing protein, partial [Alphaproteobacteria bacterium]|nr:EthD domain-containing protein [Alphaproteobacteria bacterium]